MFPLDEQIVGGYTHGQKTAYSPHHLGTDYRAKLKDGLMPFTGKFEETKGTQGGNIALITPDALYMGRKIVIRCLHLDRFLVMPGHYQKGTKVFRTGNTGMGVDAHGNVTSTANPFHLHLDISWERVDLNNFENFIDPQKFDWNYDIVSSMNATQEAEYKKQIADKDQQIIKLNTEIGVVTAQRDAAVTKEVFEEMQRTLNTEIGQVTGERDQALSQVQKIRELLA